MAGNVRGYTVKDISIHGKPEITHVTVNVGKVLPATATGNLFGISGVILVTGLVGVVSTIFSATTVKPSLGVTGSNAAIAATPAAGYANTAVGAVVQMPTSAGGALPAAVTSSGSALSGGRFIV